MIAVGLTGGIGAGKSTALAMFAEEGALVLSADQVVHELYQQSHLAGLLEKRFGPQVRTAEGTVDRRRLAEMVRGRREELRWLEELTHPLVAEEIRRFIAQAPDGSVVVCEVPLLVEADMRGLFDLTVTVEAALEQRLLRSARRTAREAFLEFESLQASTADRERVSDLVYHNAGDVAALRMFVRSAYVRAASLLDAAP